MTKRFVVSVGVFMAVGAIFIVVIRPATDPCPDRLMSDFWAGSRQAIALAVSKTAYSWGAALQNPEQVCFLTMSNAQTMPNEIARLSNLRYLNLAGNNLKTLPSDLGRLKRLEYLNLNDNQLSSLPPETFSLTNLTTLALVRNKFTDFPEDFEKLRNLKRLYLTGNPLSQTEIIRAKDLLPHTKIDF